MNKAEYVGGPDPNKDFLKFPIFITSTRLASIVITYKLELLPVFSHMKGCQLTPINILPAAHAQSPIRDYGNWKWLLQALPYSPIDDNA